MSPLGPADTLGVMKCGSRCIDSSGEPSAPVAGVVMDTGGVEEGSVGPSSL